MLDSLDVEFIFSMVQIDFSSAFLVTVVVVVSGVVFFTTGGVVRVRLFIVVGFDD